MKKLLILLAVFSTSAIASEDEHLLPEESVFLHPFYAEFSDYHADVVTVFKTLFELEYSARVVVIPSHENEYAIGVSRENNRYEISYLVSGTNIWAFQRLGDYKSGKIKSYKKQDGKRIDTTADSIKSLEEELPESISDVEVEECNFPIDRSLGESLYVLWTEMLFRTRYIDHRPYKLDDLHKPKIEWHGTTYHYSFNHSASPMSGQITSPEETSITGRFVTITKMLRDACTSKDKVLLTTLDIEVQKLLSDLEQLDY